MRVSAWEHDADTACEVGQGGHVQERRRNLARPGIIAASAGIGVRSFQSRGAREGDAEKSLNEPQADVEGLDGVARAA